MKKLNDPFNVEPRGAFQIFNMVFYDDKDPRQPPMIMQLPDDFQAVVGKLIIRWAIFEQEVEILLTAVLQANNVTVKKGEKRGFTNQWNLLLAQWPILIGSNVELAAEIAAAGAEMTKGKYLRDCFGHRRVMFGRDDRGSFLRFENENPVFPWTKRYYMKDFEAPWLDLGRATGRLFRLTNLDFAQFLTQPSLDTLKKLPNMDHLRLPMPKRAGS